MTEHSFALTPFPDTNIPDITIMGHIARQNNLLDLHFGVSGQIEKILLPATSNHPTRKDELWTATCFEFFLALPQQPHYWEFNMSSSGDWNIYRMDAYRRIGFREETAIPDLPFDLNQEDSHISLNSTVDLSPIIPSTVPMQIGITSVIQTKDRHETYWALTHPNPQADFHLRASFAIQL